MAYNPVAGIAPQYQNDKGKPLSDGWLKFYIANTTTPLAMATDAAGQVLLSKCKLSDAGFPITNPLDNDTVFIPYVDQAFRQVIYTTEAAADADDTNEALVNIPQCLPLVTQSDGIISDVEFTGVQGQTTFTVIYTPGTVRVLYNGAYLPDSDYTATNGITVTINEPVADNADIVTVLTVSFEDVEFTGTTTDTLTLSYTPGKVRVLYNGIYMSRTDYTATNGSTIVLNEPITLVTDIVTVIKLI